jgi:hypothetical protein
MTTITTVAEATARLDEVDTGSDVDDVNEHAVMADAPA